MELLIWSGFLAFFVVALVVGVRLLALAARTRLLPELLIGVGVLGIGPVGFGLSVASQQMEAGRPAVAHVLALVAMLAVAAGIISKLVFNWRVYHPARAGVRALVVVASLLLLGACVHNLFRPSTDFARHDPNFFIRCILQIGALLWGAGEALRYWRMMRKRGRLGIGDPVVCNRFLLWGIGAGAAGVGSLIGIVTQVALGVTSATGPSWVMASSSAHGMVAAIAMWLAFLPPSAYVRYVKSHQPA